MTTKSSPLRYPGGKSRAVKVLERYLPAKIDEYREPFLGGASMAIAMSQKCPMARIWVNDVYEPLYCFWEALSRSSSCSELIHSLHHALAGTKTLLKARREYKRSIAVMHDPETTKGQKAAAFYFVNRCSFSGVSSSGISPAAWERWTRAEERINALHQWTQLVSRWRITNLDYSDVISSPWVGSDPFMYLDPPYDIPFDNLYGKNGDAHRGFDHVAFQQLAEASDARIMLTYNGELQKQFHEWPVRKLWDLGYSLQSDPIYRRAQSKRRELLLLNYKPPQRADHCSYSPRPVSPLDTDHLRSLIRELGLNQCSTARLLGVTSRAVRYWVRGERKIPKSVMLALLSLKPKAGQPRSAQPDVRGK